jgi:hypothetical protein
MNVIPTETLKKMASKALAQTKAGTLRWESGTDAGDYKIDFARSSILVWNQQNDYGFVVRNANGETVGYLATTEKNPRVERQFLKEIYEAVVSTTIQLDETVDDVLKGLDGNSKPLQEDVPF